MTVLRRLAVLGLFLFAAIPQGRAQITSPIALENNADSSQTLSVYGLTFSISGCSYGTGVASGSSGGSCVGNGLELEGVQTGRDTITVEAVSSTAGSAALSQALDGTESYLNFTVNVTPSGSYVGTQASGALLTAIGVNSYNTTGCGGCSASFTTQATSSSFTTSPLTPASPWANEYSSTATQMYSSDPDSLTSPLNTFSFGENILLSTSGAQSGATLKLNTLALKFYTTPEPASIAMLLFGLGGLAMVRRRRAS
jgi:hypothetical protein